IHTPVGSVFRQTGRDNIYEDVVAERQFAPVSDFFPEHYRAESHGFEPRVRKAVGFQKSEACVGGEVAEDCVADVTIRIQIGPANREVFFEGLCLFHLTGAWCLVDVETASTSTHRSPR